MLIIMAMVSRYGALFPDLDHDWDKVKEKTLPNWAINKIIHLTGGRHRSWQTHSLDIALVATALSILVPYTLYEQRIIDLVDKEIITIMALAFCVGWLSHLVSDALTPGGIKLIFFLNTKISLVPRKFLWINFGTGSEWEDFNFKVTRIASMLLGVISVVYPIL
jgi:membrane-bound metal-dependent hydrolase YbcI (DUF457 family)